MLQKIRERSPQDELQLAQICLADGDPDEARRYGDVAVRKLQADLKEHSDNLQIRIDLAKALVFVEKIQ